MIIHSPRKSWETASTTRPIRMGMAVTLGRGFPRTRSPGDFATARGGQNACCNPLTGFSEFSERRYAAPALTGGRNGHPYDEARHAEASSGKHGGGQRSG